MSGEDEDGGRSRMSGRSEEWERAGRLMTITTRP